MCEEQPQAVTGATMKEAHVHPDTSVDICDVPMPVITHPSHMIIKVVIAGCNPKDWKMPAGLLKTIRDCPNSGDDIAGYVHEVGSAVTGFRVGDRVAALHELGAPYGSYAEYAVVYDWTTFHIGEVSFEEAATVPMGCLMATIGLFGMLGVSKGPWAPCEDDEIRPLVIYGGAGAIGAYAVKLAKLMNIHPLIVVAGNGIRFVQSLVGEGDVIVDYRKGREAVVNDIREGLGGAKLYYAFDATSEHGSWVNLSQVVESGGKISLVLPGLRKEIPVHIEQSTTMAGSLWKVLSDDPTRVHNKHLGKIDLGKNGKDFGLMFSTLIGQWLREGKLKSHPYEVVPGGLRGVETALKNLRSGRVSGTRYVVRIVETPELPRTITVQ